MSPPAPSEADPPRADDGAPIDPVDLRPAQEVALDQLVRRIGGERGPAPGGWTLPFRWPPDRRAVVAVLLVVGVVTTPFWWQLRRPRPADESLPRADATTSVAPPPPADGGPAPSGDPGPAGDDDGGGAVVVHVVGGVLRPGVLRLPAGARAVDAVEQAGGLVPLADSARVNLAAELVDGQRLVVPIVGQEPPVEVSPGPGPTRPASGSTSGSAAAPTAPLDVNTAGVEELDGLPGVGPSTAAAIVEHRATTGPFRSVDDLLEVRGIGDAKLDAIRDLVTVG